MSIKINYVSRNEIHIAVPAICCLFSWRYNPFGCIFHNPVAGFSLLIHEVS